MTVMKAPSSGVTVRMYRQGHGDCFLLAFPGKSGAQRRPVYVLIDCGYKPKSEIEDQKIDTIIADIAKATNGFIDVVVVTHEHQDHVNGFLARKRTGNKKRAFDQIRVGQVWLAWTEDGSDRFANKLRDRFNDTLVALAFANRSLRALNATAANRERAERLQELLDLEVGEDGGSETVIADLESLRDAAPDLDAASLAGLALDGVEDRLRQRPSLGPLAATIKGITNKRAIKYLRDKSEKSPKFLRPDRGPYDLPDVDGLRVFALGPPRSTKLLLDLDPRHDEEFHLAATDALALDGQSRSLLAAFASGDSSPAERSPFPNRYVLDRDAVLGQPAPLQSLDQRMEDLHSAALSSEEFYRAAYGGEQQDAPVPAGPDDESWRRIDNDWYSPVEALALRLNDEVNNTSLVLAFELPRSKRVLLFTGDAQRGNWISWAKLDWQVDGKTVSARELLSRCVFYKVGHHGSHNATLDGAADDSHPNLAWMAQDELEDDFVAMIPANTAWATTKSRPWQHPLPAIEAALQEKARGRVFRSDRARIEKPDELSTNEWRAFRRRTVEKKLYFEYAVLDR